MSVPRPHPCKKGFGGGGDLASPFITGSPLPHVILIPQLTCCCLVSPSDKQDTRCRPQKFGIRGGLTGCPGRLPFIHRTRRPIGRSRRTSPGSLGLNNFSTAEGSGSEELLTRKSCLKCKLFVWLTHSPSQNIKARQLMFCLKRLPWAHRCLHNSNVRS